MGKGPEKTFVQRRYTRARERCSRITRNIREMEMKTLMNYYCQTVRMASKKKRQANAAEIRRKGSPGYTAGGTNWYSRWGKSREGSSETENTTTIRSSFGYVSKESKGTNQAIWTPIFMAIIYNKQNMETDLTVH